ncbi:zinc-dependent alcohol dehydrogenase [Herpetosiphon giganteus]|uniref:zinc-dependent alcohol dehydrogenase n=1 Tax=Herpetosiphon giganteus TaxID=2029754 RepID=UPI001958ED9D|nr:zinc-dependent alcohol dehydrogenase [Herpetosiphon giganteus]MBM7845118.1 threonine dehydrogenase-like Zn-dependent dehydrogenase [Herpetosiphon giganteus]
MKAACWHGVHDVRIDTVPDPKIEHPRDIILKITASAICGSDLHLYDGYIPSMKEGDILGHEFMGEIVEVGSEVKNLALGERVVVPFTISCGHCFFCERDLWSACDESNPNADAAKAVYGASPAGLFGYSHLFGGYAGGQAEYVRVPYGDVGPLKVPTGWRDDQVLFLSDIFPTGYMAAENCNIGENDTVAVWGCGPVGQFAIRSAILLGAKQVIAIDRFPERLELARSAGAIPVNYADADVDEVLKTLTSGRGPDACIDAVGMEAHGYGLDALYDKAKQFVRLQSDRPTALRQAIMACRKGGTVSIPGVYGGLIDKMPIGAAFGKGLTFKMGQTHVQRYLEPLLDLITSGKIDPSFIVSHRIGLDEVPEAYEQFRTKENQSIKYMITF